MSSIRSNPETIFHSTRLSAARNTQLLDGETAAQMADIRVPDLWNNEHTIIVQETIKRLVTDRHADNLPVSGEHYEVLHDNNRLHVTHSKV